MVAVVDDLKQQREQLEKELLLASEAFERAYKPIASGWRADLGLVAISVTASSGLITIIYVLFNVLCFVSRLSQSCRVGMSAGCRNG
jgi:hypothetical protein